MPPRPRDRHDEPPRDRRDDVVASCCALFRVLETLASIFYALAAAFSCLQCLCNSGLCGCLSCIRCPVDYTWNFFWGRRLGFMQTALCCAKDCAQFWTPLSVTVLFLWLLYRPDRFRPYVGDAALAALDLTRDSANASAGLLQYDLSVDIGFRNSHRRLSISYLDVGATAFYNGTKLGSAVNSLPSFRQPPKNTTVWRPAFQGAVAVSSGEVAAQLGRERAAGAVHVRVGVGVTLLYKVWFLKNVVFYKYDCWLWFPPPRKDAPALFLGDGTQCWSVR